MSRAPVKPEEDYRGHLAAGRFMLQRSRANGAFVHPPRVAQPGTGVADLEWVEASGRGTVYSLTTVRCKPPASDYNVALVDLAEGPRVMSRVVGIPAAHVRIGMAVLARIVSEDDAPLVVFEAAR